MLNAIVAFVSLANMLLMRLCPDTDLSRTLHRHLIERPAAWLARLDRRQILVLVIAAGLLLAAGDLVVALGSAEIVLGYAADLAIYSDVVLAGLLLAAASRVRIASSIVRSRMRARVYAVRPRVGRVATQRARRLPRPSGRAANDNEGGSERAFAVG